MLDGRKAAGTVQTTAGDDEHMLRAAYGLLHSRNVLIQVNVQALDCLGCDPRTNSENYFYYFFANCAERSNRTASQLTGMQVMQVQHIGILLRVRVHLDDGIGRPIIVFVDLRVVQLRHVRVIVGDGRLAPLKCVARLVVALGLHVRVVHGQVAVFLKVLEGGMFRLFGVHFVGLRLLLDAVQPGFGLSHCVGPNLSIGGMELEKN